MVRYWLSPGGPSLWWEYKLHIYDCQEDSVSVYILQSKRNFLIIIHRFIVFGGVQSRYSLYWLIWSTQAESTSKSDRSGCTACRSIHSQWVDKSGHWKPKFLVLQFAEECTNLSNFPSLRSANHFGYLVIWSMTNIPEPQLNWWWWPLVIQSFDMQTIWSFVSLPIILYQYTIKRRTLLLKRMMKASCQGLGTDDAHYLPILDAYREAVWCWNCTAALEWIRYR